MHFHVRYIKWISISWNIVDADWNVIFGIDGKNVDSVQGLK
jgi:hypothetical protein